MTEEKPTLKGIFLTIRITPFFWYLYFGDNGIGDKQISIGPVTFYFGNAREFYK